jgi:tRNA G10  N-methylase Trm11
VNKSYIAILGRQPKLGLAELERRFGADSVSPLNETAALIRTDDPVAIDELGGSVKIANVVDQTSSNGWIGVSKAAVRYLERELTHTHGKITLGISAYGFSVTPREVQKTGLIIKGRLKNRDGSVRLVPNDTEALSSAQTFHNKFGTSPLKRELLIISSADGHGYIGELIGVQNIDAYTLRDRGRPKRDALNGMLPPKLAQIMVNLSGGHWILDPFCGTGVVLMEAILIDGGMVYGTDVNPKMVNYTKENLHWVIDKYNPIGVSFGADQADATTAQWSKLGGQTQPFSVVSETYLGEPMAQKPQPEKLAKVMEKCEEIIRGFLTNISPQLESGTVHCIAVPAWRIDGKIKHLPVVDDLKDLGYNWIDFEHVDRSDLIYYREDQIVARELLVIKKA